MRFLIRKGPLILTGLIALLFLLVAIAYVSAGRYLTSRFHGEIKPRIESWTGLRVDLGKIVINPFPFFVEARDLRLASPDGRAASTMDRVRAYFDPVALLSRRAVRVDLLSLDGVTVEGDADALRAVLALIRPPETFDAPVVPGQPVPSFQFQMDRIQADQVGIQVRLPETGMEISTRRSHLSVEPGEPAAVRLRSPEGVIRLEDGRKIPFQIEGEAEVWAADRIRVERVLLAVHESVFSVKGAIRSGWTRLDLTGDLPVRSFQAVLGLTGPSDGELHLEGSIDVDHEEPLASRLDLSISARGWIENLFEALDIDPIVAGPVQGDLKLSGPLTRPVLEGNALLRNGRILSLDDASVKVRVTYADEILSFSDGSGSIIGGKARDVAVKLVFSEDVRYTVSCNVESVDQERLFEFIGWKPPLAPGGVTGYVVVEGNAADADQIRLTGWGRYEAETGATPQGITGLSTGFALENGRLALEPMTLQGPGMDGHAAGRVDIRNDRLALDFSFRGDNVGLLPDPRFADMAGVFRVEGRADGRTQDPLVSGTVEVVNGRISGAAFDALRAEVRLRPGRLDIEHADLRIADSRLDVDGSVRFPGEDLFGFANPRLNLNVAFKNLDPNRALQLAGMALEPFRETRMSGKLALTGPLSAPELRLDVSMKDGVVFAQRFDELQADLTVDEKGVEIRRFETRHNRSILKMDGEIGREGGYCLNLSGSQVYLEDLDRAPEGLSGRVTVDADCSRRAAGGVAEALGSGTVEIENLLFRDVPFGNGRLDLKLENDRMSFAGTLLDGRGTAQGWTFLSDRPMWSLVLTAEADDYSPAIQAVFPEFPAGVSVRFGGSVTADYLAGEARARFRFTPFSAESNGRVFHAAMPLEAEYAGGRLKISPFSLQSGKTYFEGGGTVAPGEEIDLFFGGHLDLAFISIVAPALRNARGESWMVLELAGPWEHPRASGSLYLEHGRFSVENVPGSFSELQGTVFLEDEQIILDTIRGSWGGGTVELAGTGKRSQLGMERFHLEAAVRGVSLRPIRDLFVLFDADLTMDGRDGRRFVNGKVDFRKAVYRGWVDYKKWLRQARRTQGVSGKPTWFSEAELNVRIAGREPIRIDNNIARARVDADLYLVGTVGSPRLLGRLEAETGRFFFRSQEFNLTRGSVDFVDPQRINPIFSVSAETWTQGYAIRLNLEGPLDGFDMNLDADPYLSETDILALLTVGSLGSDLEGLEGGIGAAEAAAFVAGDFQSAIEEQMVFLTGVDRLQLDPHFNKTLGTLGARITLGKRLLSDQLFVTYSTDVRTMKGQTVRLEYHVFRGLSLIGQSDELGNAGADVRLHFDFD